MTHIINTCGDLHTGATVWDSLLTREWTNNSIQQQHDDKLWDMVRAILMAMELLSSTAEKETIASIPYRPAFSYTAVTRRGLQKVQESFERLETIHQSDEYRDYWKTAKGVFGDLPETARGHFS